MFQFSKLYFITLKLFLVDLIVLISILNPSPSPGLAELV